MIGRFYRTVLVLCLAGAIALAPVAPAFAQQQAPGQPPATQNQGQPSPLPPPGQTVPAATNAPVPARSIQISGQSFTHANSWFPNILGPYVPVKVPEPNLVNSPRIEQLVRDGKLLISLQDAIDLALQNNLDLLIQQYGPWIAEARINSAKGGGAAGGTFSAAGNLPTLNFDPQVSGTFSMDQRTLPVNNALLSGVGVGTNLTATTFNTLQSHTAIGNLLYSQAFHTGTAFSAGFNNTRSSTSSTQNFFNPSVTSGFVFTATQPLLNGFGLLVNERNIRIARLNKTYADETFRQQVITTITNVGTAYWELVYARGNVDVNRQSVTLAEKLYSDNQKQVQIGTLAPLEVIRAQAQLATAQQGLIAAQTTQYEDENQLMNLIAKDPESTTLRNVEVIPTDTVTLPPTVEAIALADAIAEAVTKRPDVRQAQTAIKADDISVRTSRNALLPQLNLSLTYNAQGLAGDRLQSCTQGGVCTPVTPPIVSGLGSALSNSFQGNFPEYNAQITLAIPIRNRQAQATNAIAVMTARQNESKYRQVVNNVSLDVHNAQIVLAQDRVAVEAAVKTRELQQQTLDAEQKKFQLGASTIFQIVQDQRDLATAASAEVRALVNLAQAKVNFDRAMGRTIEVNNITIADNQPGTQKDNLIPGTHSNGQLVVNRDDQTAGGGR